VVRKSLKRHAENYFHLDNGKSRRSEDKAAYVFIHNVYLGNRENIRRYYKLYKRLKKIHLRFN